MAGAHAPAAHDEQQEAQHPEPFNDDEGKCRPKFTYNAQQADYHVGSLMRRLGQGSTPSYMQLLPNYAFADACRTKSAAFAGESAWTPAISK